MDIPQELDTIKKKLIECATSILGIVKVTLPTDMEDRVELIMKNNLKFQYTDNFFSELLNFLNGINLYDEYGRGLDIKLTPGTNNIEISLHDYKFIPIVPSSLRLIKPFSPYCLALKKFIELMNELASMCQEIILEEAPDSQASVKTIIRTGMLSSFHKSKEVCESQDSINVTIRDKIRSNLTQSSLSDTAPPAGGGSKSRRRHRRKPARKTHRGHTRKYKSKSKSKPKTHRRRRHSRVRKHKKYTSRRR
jgi:hypothetical protein